MKLLQLLHCHRSKRILYNFRVAWSLCKKIELFCVSGVDNGGLVWKKLRESNKVGGQEFG